MTLEKNTYTTSNYIAAPLAEVAAYISNGMNLNEYTLFSRMKERIDDTTWLGTASGYQAPLYYHVVRRDLNELQIVEWHCGTTYREYHHVYPMLAISPSYFGSNEAGTYYHWISFVDPERATAMITQGLPTVHRSEARSMKSHIERRRAHKAPVSADLSLEAHTIYVDAPMTAVATYLADPDTITEWGYLLRREGEQLVDDYDHPIAVSVKRHDLGEYCVIEHDTTYLETNEVVRAPFLVIPTAYAFGQPKARGVILHRITAWPVASRRVGKVSIDDYNTEAINTKRIIEARVDNMSAYARGGSYVPEVAR